MVMRKKPSEAGRLALRVEGDLWVAYYAMPATMDGALFLGSIRMAFVEGFPDRKAAFMDLMKDAVGDVLKEATGVAAIWPNPAQPAPESERGGRAWASTGSAVYFPCRSLRNSTSFPGKLSKQSLRILIAKGLIERVGNPPRYVVTEIGWAARGRGHGIRGERYGQPPLMARMIHDFDEWSLAPALDSLAILAFISQDENAF
jgi:hypothetical protein